MDSTYNDKNYNGDFYGDFPINYSSDDRDDHSPSQDINHASSLQGSQNGDSVYEDADSHHSDFPSPHIIQGDGGLADLGNVPDSPCPSPASVNDGARSDAPLSSPGLSELDWSSVSDE